MPRMMAPSIVSAMARLSLVLGSAGSNRIARPCCRRSSRRSSHDMDAEGRARPAGARGRWRVCTPSGHRPERARRRAEDEQIVRFARLNLFFGGVQAVRRRGGLLSGAGDPRRGGVAVAREATVRGPIALGWWPRRASWPAVAASRPRLFIVRPQRQRPGARLTLLVNEEGGVAATGAQAETEAIRSWCRRGR